MASAGSDEESANQARLLLVFAHKIASQTPVGHSTVGRDATLDSPSRQFAAPSAVGGVDSEVL